MLRRGQQRFKVNDNSKLTPQLCEPASQHWAHMGTLQPN